MFKNLFKKSYTSINTNDHGSAGVSRAESAKADKRAAEAAQEKPEKIPSRPTAMTPESLRSLWRKCNKCEKPILVQDVKDCMCARAAADISGCMRTAGLRC